MTFNEGTGNDQQHSVYRANKMRYGPFSDKNLSLGALRRIETNNDVLIWRLFMTFSQCLHVKSIDKTNSGKENKRVSSVGIFIEKRQMESSGRRPILLLSCFLLILFEQVSAISYNQLKICPNASWNANATTFANNNTIGNWPYVLFIDTNNTIFTVRDKDGRILIWRNASVTLTTTISTNRSYSYSMFITDNEEIFLSGDYPYSRVDRWKSNGTRISSLMSGCSSCSGLFIDLIGNLYCSQWSNQVVRQPLESLSDELTIVAGTGCWGSAANMLSAPRGIFVTTTLDLYVADCGNDRVQLFREGQRNATTVAGNGSTGTIALHCPTGIVLDDNGYLFIVDSSNHRIVGQRPDGFRCLVGCSGQGSASNQLYSPQTMSFDQDGNIFVMDYGNCRIQKFRLTRNTPGQ